MGRRKKYEEVSYFWGCPKLHRLGDVSECREGKFVFNIGIDLNYKAGTQGFVLNEYLMMIT
jgi:hypothetical protein